MPEVLETAQYKMLNNGREGSEDGREWSNSAIAAVSSNPETFALRIVHIRTYITCYHFVLAACKYFVGMQICCRLFFL